MNHQQTTHTTTDRHLGRLPSGADVAVTVHRYRGGEGPTVHVQAAQHGIELNGPAALRRLHGRLLEAALAGTVVVVPLVNPLAFDHRSYITPPELDAMNPNLNRVWPGDSEGTLQERLADRLWGLVSNADAVFDLHTGTPDMLTHTRYREGDDEARRLAEAFGTGYLLTDRDEEDGEAGGNEGDEDDYQGTFRAAASRAGVPAVTVELSNSRQVSAAAAAVGADGVENALRESGVLPGAPERPAEPTVLRDGEDVEAGESGLFEPRDDLSVGEEVAAGDELGAIRCPSGFDRLEGVTVEEDGVLYSLSRTGVVVAGERLASVGTPVRT